MKSYIRIRKQMLSKGFLTKGEAQKLEFLEGIKDANSAFALCLNLREIAEKVSDDYEKEVTFAKFFSQYIREFFKVEDGRQEKLQVVLDSFQAKCAVKSWEDFYNLNVGVSLITIKKATYKVLGRNPLEEDYMLLMSSYNPSEIFTVHKTDFIQDFWFKSNHKFIEEIITLIDYQNKEKEIDFLINKIIN